MNRSRQMRSSFTQLLTRPKMSQFKNLLLKKCICARRGWNTTKTSKTEQEIREIATFAVSVTENSALISSSSPSWALLVSAWHTAICELASDFRKNIHFSFVKLLSNSYLHEWIYQVGNNRVFNVEISFPLKHWASMMGAHNSWKIKYWSQR